MLQPAQSVFVDPVLHDLAIHDAINRSFRPRHLLASRVDILKGQAPVLPLVRPTGRSTSHYQAPFSDLELNCKMVVGEGRAQVGDVVFDLVKTRLIFRGWDSIRGIVIAKNNMGSNQLVDSGKISCILYFFIQPTGNGLVVFS